MTSGRAALLALAALCASAGCYRERERLDVPELSIQLQVDSVTPGDTLRGRLVATDRSGLLLVRLLVVSRRDTISPFLDTLRLRYDLFEDRAVDLPFNVPIKPGVPVGSRVALVAAAFDNQEFSVEATDTLWVVP